MRKVFVTHFALLQIQIIYNYYNLNISAKVAKNIKYYLLASIKSLKDEDVEWQQDCFLSYLGKNHRRLICGNYKIIYYLNIKENTIYVTDVFDSRQDPKKENG